MSFQVKNLTNPDNTIEHYVNFRNLPKVGYTFHWFDDRLVTVVEATPYDEERKLIEEAVLEYV